MIVCSTKKKIKEKKNIENHKKKNFFILAVHFGGPYRAVSQRAWYGYVYCGKLLFRYRIRPYPRIDVSDTRIGGFKAVSVQLCF